MQRTAGLGLSRVERLRCLAPLRALFGLLNRYAQFAWSYAADPSSEHRADYSAECWREALQALCNFACAPEEVSHTAVVNCGGIKALVDNIGSSLTDRVTAGLQNLSSKTAFHQELLSTALLSKLQNLLNMSGSDEIRTAAAGTFANLAENTQCHHEFEVTGFVIAATLICWFQLNGIATALLNVVTDDAPKLRTQVKHSRADYLL